MTTISATKECRGERGRAIGWNHRNSGIAEANGSAPHGRGRAKPVNRSYSKFRSHRADRVYLSVARALSAALFLLVQPAFADPTMPGKNGTPGQASAPVHIAAPGGEVILANHDAQMSYERGGYAAVRRSGDLLFLSGTIVYRRPEEGRDVAAFKDQVRRTFRRIEQSLAAAGASFDDVVMINSFHVWDGPDFTGSRDEQFGAFEEVKEEFMHGPHPAWTAVGSSGLLGQGGIVEVQMIAHAPPVRGGH